MKSSALVSGFILVFGMPFASFAAGSLDADDFKPQEIETKSLNKMSYTKEGYKRVLESGAWKETIERNVPNKEQAAVRVELVRKFIEDLPQGELDGEAIIWELNDIGIYSPVFYFDQMECDQLQDLIQISRKRFEVVDNEIQEQMHRNNIKAAQRQIRRIGQYECAAGVNEGAPKDYSLR